MHKGRGYHRAEEATLNQVGANIEVIDGHTTLGFIEGEMLLLC